MSTPTLVQHFAPWYSVENTVCIENSLANAKFEFSA